MLLKRYKSTEVDCRTWLHVPSGNLWSTSSDTHQVVEIKETFTQMYTRKFYSRYGDLPREGPGFKSRMCPPYLQRDRKRRLNGAL